MSDSSRSRAYQERRREQIREAVRRFSDGLPVHLRKARQNAYKFLEREGLSQRQLRELGTNPPVAWPEAASARREEAVKTLRELRAALVASQKESVIRGALKLQERVTNDDSACARRISTHCDELLRDVGEHSDPLADPGGAERSFAALEKRAIDIERQWAAQRDRVNLSAALITHSNLCRMNHRHASALKLLNGAEYILDGLCSKEAASAVTILRHQAALWKLRIYATHLRDLDQAEPPRKLLHALTEKVGSASIQMQTLREEARCLMLWKEHDLALRKIERARELLALLPHPSGITRQTVLRLEIELLLIVDPERARKRVREYRLLWEANPTQYHLQQLVQLEKKCGVRGDSRLAKNVESTPVLIPLYQEEVLTRL